ncbi:MAG: histidine phosphatase family protein [Chloroflexi bacterium]|nr:MAG: histidine phosphatase family protein [Chloroflexota bacterium]
MDDPPGTRTLSGTRGSRASADDRDALIPDGLNATLVLLRHGESTAIVERRFQGQLDTPLSPTGLRQASLAAARLARPRATPALPVPAGPPVEIVHSPLARTAQTATLVAAAAAGSDGFGRDIPLRPDARFAEIGQGEWEGLFATEIVERWGALLDAWHRRPTEAWAPGGESLAVVDARIRAGLRDTLGRLVAHQQPRSTDPSRLVGGRHDPDGPWSIVVAHDGAFKVVLLTLLDLPLERFWAFPFAVCAITVVEFVDGAARLRTHNLTEHLAPLLEERAQEVSEERERLGAL